MKSESGKNVFDPKDLDRDAEALIEVIEEVARGVYSDRIMEFTRKTHVSPIQRVAEAVGLMMVKVEAREFQLKGLVEELKGLNRRLRRNTVQTVVAMAEALGARDGETHGHIRRVSEYAARLAQKAGLAPDEVEDIRVGGLLHDIGKIGFSDRIFEGLDTAGACELAHEIQSHPAIGVRILEHLDFLGSVLDYVHCHHERLDGTGYPRGLTEEHIPLGARIISIADCFDAMTSRRAYQETCAREKAFAILQKLAGPSLEPRLVELFIEEIEENGML